MAGNRIPGIGLVGLCGLVMVVAGLVASAMGYSDRGRVGLGVGLSGVAFGFVFLAIGVRNARKAASAA